MGNAVSTDPWIAEEDQWLRATIPTHTTQITARTHTAPSRITNTVFDPTKNIGVFASAPIAKGDRIPPDVVVWSNDPLFNAGRIQSAATATDMYAAIMWTRQQYHSRERARAINVGALGVPGAWCGHALRAIEEGAELCRMYGFATWVVEIQSLLSTATLPGYIQWVLDHGEAVCIGEHRDLWKYNQRWGRAQMHAVYGFAVDAKLADFDARKVEAQPVPSTYNFGVYPKELKPPPRCPSLVTPTCTTPPAS